MQRLRDRTMCCPSQRTIVLCPRRQSGAHGTLDFGLLVRVVLTCQQRIALRHPHMSALHRNSRTLCPLAKASEGGPILNPIRFKSGRLEASDVPFASWSKITAAPPPPKPHPRRASRGPGWCSLAEIFRPPLPPTWGP